MEHEWNGGGNLRLGAKSGMLRGRGGRRPCCRLPREERTIREAASFVACSGATETFGGLNFTPVFYILFSDTKCTFSKQYISFSALNLKIPLNDRLVKSSSDCMRR